MPCVPVSLPDGGSAILCFKRGPRRKCKVCGRPATKLCDFVVAPAHGHLPAKTCNKSLCDACAVHVGPDTDHCPDHPRATGAQLQFEGL